MTNDMSECFTDKFGTFVQILHEKQEKCSDRVWLRYLDTTGDFHMCVAEN